MGRWQYYRSQLTSVEAEAYDAMHRAFNSLSPVVSLPKLSSDSLNRVIEAFRKDNPQIFHKKAHEMKDPVYENHRWTWHLSYKVDAQMLSNYRRNIMNTARPLIDRAVRMPERDRALFLHDYLAENTTYDKADASFVVKNAAALNSRAHNILGPVLDGLAVCEGMAMAYRFLADLSDLKCIVVSGKAGGDGDQPGNHAWNIIRVDGVFYHVDTTFDSRGKAPCSHCYFLLSDAEISRSHRTESPFALPACPRSSGFLETVSGTRALMDFLGKEYRNRAVLSEVRLTRSFEGKELMNRIMKKLTFTDRVWYNAIGSYYVTDGGKLLGVNWKKRGILGI